MQADLHVHTSASDGTDSPQQVVARAAELGLRALAITDHDTVQGIEPALLAAREYGIEVIPGIELGTEISGREVHLLGYFINYRQEFFLEQLADFQQRRLTRVRKMTQRLNQLGFPVTMDRVLEIAGSGSVGRPHLARALLESGAVGSVEEAFEKWLGQDRPAYVPRFKYTPEEGVRLLRRAGGVPVFAHPALAGVDELIPRLVEEGLMGLEVYYPAHDANDVQRYLAFCRRYNLLATGGSDYHGALHREHNELGSATVDIQVVRAMEKMVAELKE
ncbi:PHP domain-containing protein [Desulfurispora thermophila]|uniref:PHP domain-containing protein n=1 Tax=Desulfurispora thermophila TaxID=265470 RepID=UPI000365DF6C|nr:PHP domain-containing protein [Desulfurispora thermophila]